MEPCIVCSSEPDRSAVASTVVIDGIAYCGDHVPNFDSRRTVGVAAGTFAGPALDQTIDAKEAVNHPSHYGGGDNPYEVIKVLTAWGLDDDAHLWNAAKYIARAGKKDPDKEIEDLEKARFYLDYAIAQRKAK